MFYRLCATSWQHWIADGIALLFIIGFTIVCAKRGFIDCFFGFISTFVALILAVTLAKTFMNVTGGLFGARSALSKGLTNWFSKWEGFDVDISAIGAEEAVKHADLPAVIGKLILKTTDKTLEPGTTLGMLLGSTAARLLCLLLCGLVLFILIKILIKILRKALTKIADSIPILDGINALLGALIGFLQAFLILSVIVGILTLFPSDTISGYFANTYLVKVLYEHNPLVGILGLFL